jgi:hypothetical protein
VEAESNSSTVALRVVGGNKKGSLESETVKYGRESHGTRTRPLARASSNCKRQNRPLVRDDVYKDYDRRCSIEKRNSGFESQCVRRQEELIGGKPPVAMLTLFLCGRFPQFKQAKCAKHDFKIAHLRLDVFV